MLYILVAAAVVLALIYLAWRDSRRSELSGQEFSDNTPHLWRIG